jgi:hypothetical protein
MSAPYFAPGGYAWRAMPGLELLPWGRARHVYEWLIWKSGNRRFELRYTDAQIAEGIGRSRRYVQFGLAELTRLGLIVRDFARKVNRWGNTLYHRVIRVLGRAAGSEPKSKDTIDLNPKKLDPHRANTGDIQSQPGALPSLVEELKLEDNKGVVVGEADGTAPPPTPGEAEAPDPERTSEALADFTARFGSKAPEPPPVASVAARPVVLTSPAERLPKLAEQREQLLRLIEAASARDDTITLDEMGPRLLRLEAEIRECQRAAEPPP